MTSQQHTNAVTVTPLDTQVGCCRDAVACQVYNELSRIRNRDLYRPDEVLAAIDWTQSLPWLYYPSGTISSALESDDIQTELQFRGGSLQSLSVSKLTFVLATFTLSGTYMGLQPLEMQLQVCFATFVSARSLSLVPWSTTARAYHPCHENQPEATVLPVFVPPTHKQTCNMVCFELHVVQSAWYHLLWTAVSSAAAAYMLIKHLPVVLTPEASAIPEWATAISSREGKRMVTLAVQICGNKLARADLWANVGTDFLNECTVDVLDLILTSQRSQNETLMFDLYYVDGVEEDIAGVLDSVSLEQQQFGGRPVLFPVPIIISNLQRSNRGEEAQLNRRFFMIDTLLGHAVDEEAPTWVQYVSSANLVIQARALLSQSVHVCVTLRPCSSCKFWTCAGSLAQHARSVGPCTPGVEGMSSPGAYLAEAHWPA